MFQSIFTAVFITVLSIIAGLAVLRLVEFARATAATGSPKRIIIGGVGFAALVVGGFSVLTWIVMVAMPTLTNSLASTPTANNIFAAGSQLAGAVDSGNLSLPSFPAMGSGAMMPSVDAMAVPSTWSGGAANGTTFTAPDGSTQTIAPPSTAGESTTATEEKAAAVQGPVAQPTAAGEYAVQSGDSLSAIAKAIYGDSNAWVKLCEANRAALGGNCNNIRRGMKLVIPTAGANVVPVVKANQPSGGWGQTLVKPAPVVYGPVVKAAPTATPTVVAPMYDLSAKNFWSQFETAK